VVQYRLADGMGLTYRFAAMSTVQEIEAAIRALPREEFSQLWKWWDEFREAAWDRQIETDLQAGKLDKLLDEADRDFEQGRCKPLP
jgi:hypothetical protein